MEPCFCKNLSLRVCTTSENSQTLLSCGGLGSTLNYNNITLLQEGVEGEDPQFLTSEYVNSKSNFLMCCPQQMIYLHHAD